MLGSTQIVDMETTRKSEFGRILVAVLNPLLIPAQLDVVIGDHYFELEFKVEKMGFDENGEEADFEWTGIPMQEGDGGGEEEDPMEEDLRGNRGAKRLKSAAAQEEGNEEMDDDNFKKMIQNMSQSEFNKFLEKKAREIVDVAAMNVIDWAANKVMNDDEKEGDTAEATKEGNAWKEGEIIRKEAAIPEVVVTPIRSSPRLAQSNDEHTMDKIQKRAAARNLEEPEGNPIGSSISLPLPLNNAIFKIQKLGIGCGENSKKGWDVVEDLLVIENNCEQNFLWENDSISSASEDENIDALESEAVKRFCGELVEEIFDDDSYHLSSDLRAASIKNKPRAKTRRKKACKVALDKSLKKVYR
jgi:hypothetical protein